MYNIYRVHGGASRSQWAAADCNYVHKVWSVAWIPGPVDNDLPIIDVGA